MRHTIPSPKWKFIAITAIVVLCAELAIIFCFGGILNHFFVAGPGLINRLNSYYGHDFLAYYAAAKIALNGDAAAAYDTAMISAKQTAIIAADPVYAPWVYPPTFLFVVLPFGLLPYIWAYIAWSASNIIAGIIAGAAVFRCYWMPAVVILAPLTWLNIFAGQNGGIFAAFMLGGLGLINRSPISAGILFGMMSFKPQFGILIPIALAAGRYWTCLVAMIACAIVLSVLAYLMFGISSWLEFLALMTKAFSAKDELSAIAPALEIANESSQTEPLWLRSVTIFAMARLAGLGLTDATVLQALSAILVIGIVIYAWHNHKALELRAAIVAIGTLLATPRAMIYDLPFLMVPMLFVLRRLRHSNLVMADWIFLALLWLCPVVGFFIFEGTRVQVWPILLWAAMLYCIVRYSTPAMKAPQSQRFPNRLNRLPNGRQQS